MLIYHSDDVQIQTYDDQVTDIAEQAYKHVRELVRNHVEKKLVPVKWVWIVLRTRKLELLMKLWMMMAVTLLLERTLVSVLGLLHQSNAMAEPVFVVGTETKAIQKKTTRPTLDQDAMCLADLWNENKLVWEANSRGSVIVAVVLVAMTELDVMIATAGIGFLNYFSSNLTNCKLYK